MFLPLATAGLGIFANLDANFLLASSDTLGANFLIAALVASFSPTLAPTPPGTNTPAKLTTCSPVVSTINLLISIGFAQLTSRKDAN